MSSVKLTVSLRENILSKMMERWDEKNPRDLSEGEKLAHEIFYRQFNDEERSLLETLPKKWTTDHSSIIVRISNKMHEYATLTFSGDVYQTAYYGGTKRKIVADKSIRFPNAYELSNLPFEHLTQEDIDKIRHIISKYEKYFDARNSIKKNLKKTLDSFTTTKQILEAWPECAPFLPVYTPRSPATQIAIRTDILNTALDLPVEETV